MPASSTTTALFADGTQKFIDTEQRKRDKQQCYKEPHCSGGPAENVPGESVPATPCMAGVVTAGGRATRVEVTPGAGFRSLSGRSVHALVLGVSMPVGEP